MSESMVNKDSMKAFMEMILNLILLLSWLICCVIGVIAGRSSAPRTEEIVELSIVVPRPGRLGYSDQMSILYSFGVELAGRYWNRFPGSRHWLKKYIEAFADSTFEINENQSIEIDIRGEWIEKVKEAQ